MQLREKFEVQTESHNISKRTTTISIRSLRIHTLSVHHEHYSLLTSTDHMCACGSGLKAKGREGLSRIVSSLCSEKNPSSGQPSSPCWSLPHLLSSSPPQHEAPLGQHDFLQDDTGHRAPLPEPIQSTSSANEPLSHVQYVCGGNPRNTSPTVCGCGFHGVVVSPAGGVGFRWTPPLRQTAQKFAFFSFSRHNFQCNCGRGTRPNSTHSACLGFFWAIL